MAVKLHVHTSKLFTFAFTFTPAQLSLGGGLAVTILTTPATTPKASTVPSMHGACMEHAWSMHGGTCVRGCRCLLVSGVMLGGLFVGLGYEASAYRSPCSGLQIRNPAGLNFKNSCKHKCGSQAVLVMPAPVLALGKTVFCSARCQLVATTGKFGSE